MYTYICPSFVTGMPLRLRAPNGTLVQVTVPMGINPGQTFQVMM